MLEDELQAWESEIEFDDDPNPDDEDEIDDVQTEETLARIVGECSDVGFRGATRAVLERNERTIASSRPAFPRASESRVQNASFARCAYPTGVRPEHGNGPQRSGSLRASYGSTLILAAFTTPSQRASSAFRNRLNSPGNEAWISSPWDSRRFATAEERSTFAVAD